MPKKDMALFLISLGFYIFPVKNGTKDGQLVESWKQNSSNDKKQIEKWWDKWPDANIAIATEPSGLIVFDYDIKNGKKGLEIRKDWQARHGNFVTTATVETWSGGLQEYRRIKAPVERRLQRYEKSVDFLSKASYVVAPGSIVNGNEYKWLFNPTIYGIADLDVNAAAFYFFSDENDISGDYKPKFTMPELEEGSRVSTLISAAFSLKTQGFSDEGIKKLLSEENDRSAVPLSDNELERQVFPALTRPYAQVLSPYWMKYAPDPALIDKLTALDPFNNKKYGMNDAGSARLFIDVCGDVARYVKDRKTWFFFDGRKWDINGDLAVREKIKNLADALYTYITKTVADDKKRLELLKFYGKWQQLGVRMTVLNDATSICPVESIEFDQNIYLFNCQNGTLDLRTKTLKEHSAHDMLTKMSRFIYDPGAKATRFESFISEIMNDDVESGEYLQKAHGYALTGDTRYECLFMYYGPTSRNGKSTLLEVIAYGMGDYAITAMPESFMKKKLVNSSGPTEDIARLAGVRLVSVSEPPRNMELNASLIKSLTGRDKITARRLHEGSFEFIPMFKLFFNTNHRPLVNDLSVFNSDRVKVIPFEVHFDEEHRDPDLKRKLQDRESLSGILNWCLDGLDKIRNEGFDTPAVIKSAIDAYKQKEDKFGRFLEEKTEKGDFEVPLLLLQSAFTNWCTMSGLEPVGLPKFKEWLEEKQLYTKKKRPKGSGRNGKTAMFVMGLRLLTDEEENAEN